ncbi:MAG: helix-turn-helix domain-containing protein [Oscillospiraceae bacterium]|nr:helix-turn-helix domain-containing protein [Oscillospiraceae bacterium]
MLPRMRTIPETIKLLREYDPGTSLTETALRRMVLTNQIPYTRVGKKYLINVDALIRYLSGDEIIMEPVTAAPPIRAVQS